MGRRMRPATWVSFGVLVGMLAIAILAARQLPGLTLENTVHTWLAPDDPEAVVLQWCHDRFPEQDQTLISWDGSSLNDPRVGQLADALAGPRDVETGLRTGGLPCVVDAVTPHDLLAWMSQLDVDQAEGIERLRGVLIGDARSVDVGPEEGADSSPVAVLATLAPGDTATQRRNIQAIRNAAADCGIPASNLHLGGETVTSAALDAEVLNAAWNVNDPLQRPPVFLLSALAGAFLAIGILHSVRLGIMVLACACFTALIGTALVPYFGHSMNMVVIVMPTLLIVLTLSAAIHLANYWRRAAASGADHPIREAIRMAWLPCLLAAATTGIGLITLSISPLQPIRTFGLFAAAGTLLSFPVVLLGLPAMMVVLSVRPVTASQKPEHTAWKRLGGCLSRHRRLVTCFSLVLFGVTTLGLIWGRTEVKVARYFPDDSQLAVDYSFIERELGGIVPVEVLVSFDENALQDRLFLERAELVRDVQSQITRHPEISGAVSLADFLQRSQPLPGDATFLTRTRHAVRNRVIESRMDEDAAAAGTFLYSEVSTTEEDASDSRSQVWRIRAQAYVTSDADYGELTNELRATVAAALSNKEGVECRVTGTVPLFFRAQQALLSSLMRGFWLASAVIAVAMVVLLKSVKSGLLSMLPAMLPVGLVFGIMSWNRQPLDIGTMLTASIALGISVDGTLHLLTWFRNAIAAGHSREAATALALQQCGPAMLQTNAVIGVSLLMFYPAELLLISRFGWVMAALITSAFTAEVVFLPALLSGSLGQSIQRTLEAGVRAAQRRHDGEIESTATSSVASIPLETDSMKEQQVLVPQDSSNPAIIPPPTASEPTSDLAKSA